MRGQLKVFIDDFMARGGKIVRVPEGDVTIDWSYETRDRERARRNAQMGHAKRWGHAA